MRCLWCLVFGATCCAVCPPATAGAVYKCHEGMHVIYADRPCAGAGAPLALPPTPAPDPMQATRLAAARAALTAIDRTRAAQAERDAHEFERAGRAALALRKRCDKLRLQARWADEDLARSSDAAKAIARVKARRQAEALAVECPG
ncbi:hypothetical protein RCH14_004293 [Massilia sp. MP_M2]